MVEITHTFTMRSDRLDVARNGRKTAEISYVSGSATFHEMKSKLLEVAGESIYRKQAFPGFDRAGDQLEEIAPLAEAGWNMLRALFGPAGAAEIARVVSKIPISEGVELRQTKCWIPWNLAYLDDPANGVTLDKFMGSKHLLVDVLNSHVSSAPPRPKRSEWRVGLIDDDLLPSWSAEGIERQELARHGGQGFVPLYVPGHPTRRPLRDANRSADMDRYGFYVSDNWDVLHFAAHAIAPLRDPVLYELRVSTNFKHTMPALMKSVGAWGGIGSLPFVFFNTCHSSLAQATGEFGPAWDFSAHGVRVAIGTSTEICDEIAGEFAAAFYDFAFTSGVSAGDAFLAAKAALLSKYGNPAVLVYHFHGHASYDFPQKVFATSLKSEISGDNG